MTKAEYEGVPSTFEILGIGYSLVIEYVESLGIGYSLVLEYFEIFGIEYSLAIEYFEPLDIGYSLAIEFFEILVIEYSLVLEYHPKSTFTRVPVIDSWIAAITVHCFSNEYGFNPLSLVRNDR